MRPPACKSAFGVSAECRETGRKRVSAGQAGSQPVAQREPGKYIPQGTTEFRKRERGWVRFARQRSVGELCAAFARRTVALSADSRYLRRSQRGLCLGLYQPAAPTESARVVHDSRHKKLPRRPDQLKHLFRASLATSSRTRRENLQGASAARQKHRAPRKCA